MSNVRSFTLGACACRVCDHVKIRMAAERAVRIAEDGRERAAVDRLRARAKAKGRRS